ncbi:hypothetical protein CfE428DRAFT_4413 [Chthoniobacter flavus Ellin428]|uniref:DUF6259 domain-containing protein n=1 Tax=Chthoniobacter flavus Ellin428 TaxID=497964 RepID=B4D674_9BACT|nr:hypothetical protein CfE428DRAFT_4413 [Chthoniobacter flavus Ellin428]TCO88225.1 hypothetical protein EV701_11821 [Chthoniobacter flavus]
MVAGLRCGWADDAETWSKDAPPPWLFRSPGEQVYPVEHEGYIGSANQKVGFVFRKADGALVGIWPVGQRNLLADAPKTPLWTIETMPATAKDKPGIIVPDGATKVTFGRGGEGQAGQVDVTYETPTARVVVFAALDVGASLVRWKIDVEALAENPGIWSVTFPQFAVAALDADPTSNEMVVPYRRGQTRGFGKAAPRGDVELPYPGPSAKFQFLAAYGRKAGRGFYFSARDGEGFTKTFAVRNRPEADAVVISAQHFPANRGAAVKRFAMPYEIVAGPFDGDWWDAAREYRMWWTKQVWASRGLLAERHDLPDWLVHAPIVTRPSTTKPARTVANNLTALQSLSEAFSGRPFFGIWYGCFETPKAGQSLNESGLGHVLPPKPGLVEAVREMRGKGVHLQAYIQSMIYDAGIPDSDAAEADRAATHDRLGNRVSYGVGEPQLLAMCRATEWWQKRLVDLSRRAVGEWGFSGVYLDSFGKGAPECFAADHGHPIGGGNTVISGQRALVQRVRNAVREVDREAILSGEDPIEAFRDLLDVNLYSVNVMTNYVPIYRTVWGDYSLGHGRALAPGKSGGSLIPELATLFLEGTIPGRIYTDSPKVFLLQPEHAQEFAFLKSIAAYTDHGLPWLRFGEYLHPLALPADLPTVEFHESVENQIVRGPAILNSVTRSHADGSIAIVLVNIDDKKQVVSVPIDPVLRSHMLDKEVKLRRMNEQGEMSDLASGHAEWKQKLELAPGEIAFLVLQ